MRMLTEHEHQSLSNAVLFKDITVMQRQVPALFATFPSPKMSDKYGFTDTYSIMMHLINRGWTVVSVQQTGKGMFGKLMLRLEHVQLPLTPHGKAQIVIIDSHDGTAAFKIMLGWYRFVCANGLILGKHAFATSIKHNRADIGAQVLLDMIDATYAAQSITKNINDMRCINLDVTQQLAYARQIAAVRANVDPEDRHAEARLSIIAGALLTIRRAEDARRHNTRDLYTTMNVVQENALRGDVRYGFQGSINTIRPISSINMQYDVNTACWDVAQNMLQAA